MNKNGSNIYNNYKKHSLNGFKSGAKFATYFYLGATIAGLISPFFLIFGAQTLFTFLILPLATFITNPIAWVMIGTVLIVASAVAMSIAKPLFHLAKDFINERKTPKKENSEEEGIELRELEKPNKGEKLTRSQSENSIFATPDSQKSDGEKDAGSERRKSLESGYGSPPSNPQTPVEGRRDLNSFGGSVASFDSGLSLDGKKFCEDWPTLVHQTNRRHYDYWLQQHDIAYIARVVYRYSESTEENSESNAFFSIPGDVNSLNERLKEYKNNKDSKKIFTSVINLEGNHWVTLVVTYDKTNKKFVAYYCDSFGNQLPSDSDKLSDIKLANKITQEQINPLTNKIRDLIRERESDVSPSSSELEEQKKNMNEALRCVREDRSKLVNKKINVYYIVSVLQETLGISDIRSSKTKQQNDGCNCGIFALENANRITRMLTEGKSLDEVETEYKLDLNEKRREFRTALMNSEKWKTDIAEGGILHRTIQELILEGSRKNESSLMEKANPVLQGVVTALVGALSPNSP